MQYTEGGNDVGFFLVVVFLNCSYLEAPDLTSWAYDVKMKDPKFDFEWAGKEDTDKLVSRE